MFARFCVTATLSPFYHRAYPADSFWFTQWNYSRSPRFESGSMVGLVYQPFSPHLVLNITSPFAKLSEAVLVSTGWYTLKRTPLPLQVHRTEDFLDYQLRKRRNLCSTPCQYRIQDSWTLLGVVPNMPASIFGHKFFLEFVEHLNAPYASGCLQVERDSQLLCLGKINTPYDTRTGARLLDYN